MDDIQLRAMYSQLKQQHGEELIDFVYTRYQKKFPNHSLEQFLQDFEAYRKVPAFRACENIYEIATDHDVPDDVLADSETRFVKSPVSITPEFHWIMRMVAQYYVTQAFKAMKIDLNDPNVEETSLGKGTPGRIVKEWVGADLDDCSELGSGRWTREPFVSRFPSNDNHSIITKEVDIVASCSHHFIPFTTLEGGRAVIKYRPGEYVIGISKLQRLVNWAARRFWLQEDLTEYIGRVIQRIANTEDVYVLLEGVVHGCERYRGVCSRDGSLTTEFKGGCFKDLQ